MNNTHIEISNLSFTYDSGIEIFKNLSLSIKKGEFISIVGPSGCGKSTLIRLIGDLLTPTRGEIKVENELNNKAREKGKFSFVFQNPVLLPWRTVEENISLPSEILISKEHYNPLELLEIVGLKDREKMYPHQLSGGMKQRVAIARALSFKPSVLLMDEPFSAVDEFTRKILNQELLRIWNETEVTIIFITHSVSEAIFLSDRVFVLSFAPSTLKMDYHVPFSRPREKGLEESIEFIRSKKCLRQELII